MPAKGTSEGYVYFNKQRKRWNAQYLEYDENTGKSIRKTKSFKSEDEAKKYLKTIMYQKENPMINVIKPRSFKENKIVRALTVEEQQNFTNYLLSKNIDNCKYKNVYLIQMYMGLRVGETLALTTHDIDLKNKKINVHRTLTTDENNAIIMGNTTKTYAGKRVLPIPDFLYPYIIEQM